MSEEDDLTKAELIDKIIIAQLGELHTWKKPKIEETVGPYKPSIFDEFSNRISSIKGQLKMRLRKLLPDELEFWFNSEGALNDGISMETEDETNLFFADEILQLKGDIPIWLAGGFGNRDYYADFQYWGQMSKYTLHEALLLSVGIEPKHILEKLLDKMANSDDLDRFHPAYKYLVLRRKQFHRKFPAGYDGWSNIPQRSLKAWIDAVELDVHDKFYAELEKFHPKQKEKTAGKPSTELSNQERQTLLKMIAAMACEQYGFDPSAERSSSTSAIRDDIGVVGLSMDSKTILKWLKEAVRLVPKEYWGK
ncbi:MAG: hypothetical protein QM488_04035 [Rhizobiaceae bacterium]